MFAVSDSRGLVVTSQTHIQFLLSKMVSELILEWGVEEARPEMPRTGDGVLGQGTANPSPPTGGFAGAL